MQADLRRVLDALLAAGIGTTAGRLLDGGFGLPMSFIRLFYDWLRFLFELLGAYPNGQLVLAGLIYRLPVVLVMGLLVGLLLRYARYPRLLLGSILVWPAWMLLQRLARAVTAEPGGIGALLLRSDAISGAFLYLLQYGLMFLVVHVTHAALLQLEQQKALPVPA